MKFKHPNLKHQAEEWEHRADKSRAIFWEMGLGKSKTGADKMAWLYLQGLIDVVIILAPNGTYSNWKYVELPEHMTEEVPYVCEIYRSSMKEFEKEKIRQLVKPQDKLRILCVNVESLTFAGGQVAKAMAKSRKKGLLLLVDESTCVKNKNAGRSKVAYDIAKFANYKVIMTGTPITRSPMDLWGQAKVLGRGILGHTTLTSFRGEYAIIEKQFLGQRTFDKITGFKNLDALNKQISTFATIKTREECLDLPPKIYKKVAIPLTSVQEKMYNQMRDEALAELGDGVIVEAVNALGVISRLDQIACGQIKRPDGSFEILDSGRFPALVEMTDETSKKGIIWSNYRGILEDTYTRMVTRYGKERVGRYYGGVPDDEREEYIRRFQDPYDDLWWIVGNQQSLGYGRTLTRGKENYFLSNGYNLEHRLQSEDRTMRYGQDESVLYTDMFTPNTINDRVLHLLRTKRALASEVLGTRLRDWI